MSRYGLLTAVCCADYKYEHIVRLPAGDYPRNAIDAFVKLFEQVRSTLVVQIASGYMDVRRPACAACI